MQFLRLNPQFTRLRFLFWNSAHDHPQEVFCLARFFSARADVLQEFLLRHSVVSLDIIGTHTTRSTDELTDQPGCHRTLRNRFREIDYRFTESRGPLL